MDLSSLFGDDEELTPLFDAEIPRVDLVHKPASGIPRFLLAKQDEASAALLDPEFVRELIGKQADPEPSGRERVTMPSGVTLSGSPADIAAFIHKAAQRAGDRDQFAETVGELRDAGMSAEALAGVVKAEMSSKSVNDLDDDQFAYIEPGGKKDESGKTTPRSLRHFPINDPAHIRNALSRASQSPFGDKAMPKIRAAAKRFGIEVSKEAGVPETVTKDAAELDDGIDGMDPTVPLAAPGEEMPGDPTDPGSPAWEAIDAATACKWTSILARARVAIDLLAEREMLEAASADPDDAGNACDLADVCCAIDYAIGVLAPFAVAEQSEADCGADEMAMVGKAAGEGEPGPMLHDAGADVMAVRKAMESADLPDALAKIEGLAWVRKAGRVLSSVNEAHIREAATRLNTVLQSLPQAPVDDGQPVAKMTPETEADMPETAPSEKVTAASGQAPAMGTAEQPPAAQEAIVTKEADAEPDGGPVAKADGEGKTPMMVVYNQAGKLVGIVDPSDITPVANAEADPEDDMDSGGGDDAQAAAPAAPAADGGDMTPAPAAEVGTPADDVAKAGAQATPVQGAQDTITVTQDVLKSIVADAMAAALGAQAPAEDIAKQADVAGLSEQVETLKARLAQVEEQPAAPKVFTNGAVPPAHQMRGQDQGAGAQPVDVAKALDLKHKMYTADPGEAKQIHDDLQQMAIDQLAAIHRR